MSTSPSIRKAAPWPARADLDRVARPSQREQSIAQGDEGASRIPAKRFAQLIELLRRRR
jgi:hypothetical protein